MNNDNHCLGYTLVELVVVLAVIGIFAMMTIYGLRSFDNTEPVKNAQKEFVVNLNGLLNRVDSGEMVQIGGVDKVVQQVVINNNSTSYTINQSGVVNLQNGVRMYTVAPSGNLTLCFPNRNLSQYDYPPPTHQCSSCTGTTGFVCRGGAMLGLTNSVTVRFQKGAFYKDVVITGSGVRVTQINAL